MAKHDYGISYTSETERARMKQAKMHVVNNHGGSLEKDRDIKKKTETLRTRPLEIDNGGENPPREREETHRDGDMETWRMESENHKDTRRPRETKRKGKLKTRSCVL